MLKHPVLEIKRNPHILSIEWSNDSSGELKQHIDVLHTLNPLATLELLRIHSYRASGFPKLVKDLTLLQHLTKLVVQCVRNFPNWSI